MRLSSNAPESSWHMNSKAQIEMQAMLGSGCTNFGDSGTLPNQIQGTTKGVRPSERNPP